jgi:riboflavin-specific deaminase-like protein
VSWAQSLDGRIATVTGDSRWISGPDTLTFAHRLRRDNDAILVGIGTVLSDDPELTCRLPGPVPSPVRIVLDSFARTPLSSKLASTAQRYDTVVFTRHDAEPARLDALRGTGIRVERTEPSGPDGTLDLLRVLEKLTELGFASVLVEGGRSVITSFLRLRLVSKLFITIAPILIGEGVSAVGDLGVLSLSDAYRPIGSRLERFGTDAVWELTFETAVETEGGSKTAAASDTVGPEA